MVVEILIGLSICVLAYCYGGYALSMLLAARLFGKPWRTSEVNRPSFSIILAVYNEEIVLRACLDSLLALDHAGCSVEILVGSDGSSDATASILAEYAARDPRLKPFIFADRRGKIAVVNDLVAHANGDVLFFTDADVTLAPWCLEAHARHYADPLVGGVSGNLVFAGGETEANVPLDSERYYMSLESQLRQNEGMLHSTVGIFGGHYSLRRECWRVLPDLPICDELYLALSVIQSGKRMIFDREAIAQEYFARTIQDEFRRKMRFASRGLKTLALFPRLMSPRAGVIALMLWSHKLLRWISPFFVLGIAVLTGILILSGTSSTALNVLIDLEVLAVALVLLGALAEKSGRKLSVASQANWFAAMSVAFAMGVLRYFFNREQHFWAQTSRVAKPSGPEAAGTPTPLEVIRQ